MEWLEVTIKTISPAIELLGEHLTSIGYDSFIIDDSADFQTFLEENTQYWDYVDEELARSMTNVSQIRLYIENNSLAPDRLSSLRSDLDILRSKYSNRDLGSLEIQLNQLQEEDWENSCKQYYQPISVGKKLIIVPEWLQDCIPSDRIPVLLDPGMIFGTGAHASTQMCLRWLEDAVSGGERVIDLGSGSGILSIASLLLGASSAIGVDIDPKAEDIARDNASLNGLHAPKFKAITGNVIGDQTTLALLSEEQYDIVLANIVADVIIPLAPIVPRLLKKGGVFICSGILNTRQDEVLASIENAGMAVTAQEEQDDWCCFTAIME